VHEDNIDDDDDDNATVISGEADVVYPESTLLVDTQQCTHQTESKDKHRIHQGQFVEGSGCSADVDQRWRCFVVFRSRVEEVLKYN
jgi:hypothetical protein